MQIQSKANAPIGFTPFDLTLKFEKPEEAMQFYALFNHLILTSFAKSLPHSEIRDEIRKYFVKLPHGVMHDQLVSAILNSYSK